MKRCLSLLLTLAACTTLQAQTVWRCGADGRSYGDTACADGRVAAVADPRSAADAAAAREVLARDQRLAKTLVAERHEREREWAARGNGLSGIGGAAAVKPAAKVTPAKKHPKKQRQLQKPRPAAA